MNLKARTREACWDLITIGMWHSSIRRSGGAVSSVAGTRDEAETRPRHVIDNVAREVTPRL